MGFIATVAFVFGLFTQNGLIIVFAIIMWVIDFIQTSNRENAIRINMINARRRQTRLENIRFDLERNSKFDQRAMQHNLAVLQQFHDADFITLVYTPRRLGYEYDSNGYLVKMRY